MQKLLLLADQNIHLSSVELLVENGYDVVRTKDVLNLKASDAEITEYAFRAGCVILTQDKDFTDIVFRGSEDKLPIVVFLKRLLPQTAKKPAEVFLRHQQEILFAIGQAAQHKRRRIITVSIEKVR